MVAKFITDCSEDNTRADSSQNQTPDQPLGGWKGCNVSVLHISGQEVRALPVSGIGAGAMLPVEALLEANKVPGPCATDGAAACGVFRGPLGDTAAASGPDKGAGTGAAAISGEGARAGARAIGTMTVPVETLAEMSGA